MNHRIVSENQVQIRGPKEDVDKAKKLLLELTSEKQISGHTIEVKARPEHHKFLIGKGGANIRKVWQKILLYAHKKISLEIKYYFIHLFLCSAHYYSFLYFSYHMLN